MDEIAIGLIVAAIALLASTIAAVAGFGGAVIMLPVLTWAFGVRDAVPILTVAQLMGNLSRVGFNRQRVDTRVVGWFAAGAIPTAVVGGIVFATASASALTRVLGVFLIATALYRHTSWGKGLRVRLYHFFPIGLSFGFLSALLGSVGPIMAPLFLAYGLTRGAYIGTEAFSTVVMHVTKLVVYGSYALLAGQTLLIGLAIGLVMIIGSYLGKLALGKVAESAFALIIDGTLFVGGLLFIIGLA